MIEPTHADILARLDAGNRRFSDLEEAIKQIGISVGCLPAMQKDISETRDIVEAWQAAKAMGKFVKWAAGIVIAFTAIIVAVKSGLAHVMK